MTVKDRVLADLRVGCGGPRPVRSPRGTSIACRGWLQEAALRMLCNNLDPANAEDPDRLVGSFQLVDPPDQLVSP